MAVCSAADDREVRTPHEQEPWFTPAAKAWSRGGRAGRRSSGPFGGLGCVARQRGIRARAGARAPCRFGAGAHRYEGRPGPLQGMDGRTLAFGAESRAVFLDRTRRVRIGASRRGRRFGAGGGPRADAVRAYGVVRACRGRKCDSSRARTHPGAQRSAFAPARQANPRAPRSAERGDRRTRRG